MVGIEGKEAMTVSTFYPDADPETTSVDGEVRHVYSSPAVAEDWAVLIAAIGNLARDATTTSTIEIGSGGVSNKWDTLYRGILLFDTSSLPDGSSISDARIKLYGQSKFDNLNITPNINICAALPASNIGLVGTDFATLESTPFCDTPITYANWTISGWNEFILNAAGIAAISKTGITKLGVRNANYDVAASAPTWSSVKGSGLVWYASEQASGKKPELIITTGVPRSRAYIID